ncbi:lytic transglycosylase domain-containing protein [Galbitalea soli]|uniref:Lytic transglycosylase domain-containing protein n=2 Tax=Galbitalea soli TaxID=1268042 RepID=A0A7C9TQV0_9MICO|nr:lytic transglycosylase domain-containing protein [Galbitalea soli]
MVVDPYSGAYADAVVAPNHWSQHSGQTVIVDASAATKVTRDSYSVRVPTPASTPVDSAGALSLFAPIAGTPDPGSAKAIAKDIVQAKGWGDNQYNCLVALWNRESGWNVYASNPSGAYGIPQALPGSKMASAGPNWQSNPRTQILWGLSYIQGRYGNPCGAWAHSQSSGWY